MNRSVRSSAFALSRMGMAVFAGLSVWSAIGCEGVSDRDIRPLTIAEARRIYDDASRPGNSGALAIIDPRSPREFNAGHIPGARNLRLSDFPSDAPFDERLASHDVILVYGNNPASAPAKAMTKRLIAGGYEGVRLMPGGLEEWERAGGPVERPQAPATPAGDAPPSN
ncbi:MAG: rhodanese-like domain-containing protein [Planctomycetota bacterium]|nr:rhodanese-like domain-containing protein [Planctomycetota bacterium]